LNWLFGDHPAGSRSTPGGGDLTGCGGDGQAADGTGAADQLSGDRIKAGRYEGDFHGVGRRDQDPADFNHLVGGVGVELKRFADLVAAQFKVAHGLRLS